MQSQSRKLILALLLAAPLAWAPLASAQDYGADAAGAMEVSAAQVDAFASALQEVQAIGQEWTQRMQEAEDQGEIADMREQARNQMVTAIEDEGMTVEEYNRIATAAQNDPELAQRIHQAVAEF